MGSAVKFKSGILNRAAALLTALVLLLFFQTPALADPVWPEETEGQRLLKEYVEQANVFLQEQKEQKINSLFEAYAGLEVFGITDLPDAETPEGVEITAKLFATAINSVEIRVSYIPRFPQIAAAFIRALTPDTMSMEEALAAPSERAQRALKNPGNSFEEEVEVLNGTMPYIYYAYYPNQYSDGVNWIQMTIVFPLSGYWNGEDVLTGETVTRGPDEYSDHAEDYEGFYSEDDYDHYEYFTTATPEPDSAAMDYFPVR